MQTKSLIEAKIVNVYNLNGKTYRKSIVIFLPTRTIFFYPVSGNLVLVRNRKYSIRRLLRCAKRGCCFNIQKAELISQNYPTVYLQEKDLEKIIGNKTLRNEIYNETFNA
jgi:hypothetical protein